MVVAGTMAAADIVAEPVDIVLETLNVSEAWALHAVECPRKSTYISNKIFVMYRIYTAIVGSSKKPRMKRAEIDISHASVEKLVF